MGTKQGILFWLIVPVVGNGEMIFSSYTGGVEGVVYIDPYFHSSDVPSTDPCHFFYWYDNSQEYDGIHALCQ